MLLTDLLKVLDKYDFMEIYEDNSCLADGYADSLQNNFALQGKRVTYIGMSYGELRIEVEEND